MNETALTLTGYGYSVYTRAARMALMAAGAGHDDQECDPFDPAEADQLRALHPFARVPVLTHGDFRLYETTAILHYTAEALGGGALLPEGAHGRARMRQVMGIADAYVYRPLVRQAVSHSLFLPAEGTPGDPAQIRAGLTAAPRALDALEAVAAEGLVLRPGSLDLAGCHLWPMLDYFAMLEEGRTLMEARPALWSWARAMGDDPVALATRPDMDAYRRDLP